MEISSSRKAVNNPTSITEIPWLLVLDGADYRENRDVGDDPLRNYLPSGAFGSILITSRNAALVAKYGGALLSAFEEKEAVSLLLGTIRREGFLNHQTGPEEINNQLAAQKIVRRLGYFPLAISEAAYWLANQRPKSLSDYVDAYEKNETLYGVQQPHLYNKSVDATPFKLSTVWNMSYESLTKDQQSLLNMISFFDAVGIHIEFLSNGAAKAYERGVKALEFIATELKFRRCKTALTRTSLVMQNEYVGQLWTHRLVQEFCQARMNVIDRQIAWDRCLDILEAEWPVFDRNDRHRIDLWPIQGRYLPHIQSVAYWFQKYDSSRKIKANRRFAEILVQAAR